MQDESLAQRRLRLYREEKARKKAAAKINAFLKAEKEHKARVLQKAKKPLDVELVQISLELASQRAAREAAERKAAEAKAIKVAERTSWRLCICCGDDKDIKKNGMCEQCWREKTYGIIEPPPISDRQFKSAQCRNVRKGHEMS